MKLTPKLQEYIEKQIKLYSKFLSLEVPLSIYTDYELSGMVVNHKEYQYIKKHTIGESWHHKDTKLDFDVIYINVDNSDFLWQLIDTVVHELLHLKHPKLRHGSKFQQRINNVIMNIPS